MNCTLVRGQNSHAFDVIEDMNFNALSYLQTWTIEIPVKYLLLVG
jgi:hypothetical protein